MSANRICPIAIGPVKSRSIDERPEHERLRPRRKRNEDGGVPPNGSVIFGALNLRNPIDPRYPKAGCT
jgi:hypothetical protein